MSSATIAPENLMTAAELVAECRRRGVRIYRQSEGPRVGSITGDPEVAGWLLSLGARRYEGTRPDGSYTRDPVTGRVEYDLEIHMATVREHFIEDKHGAIFRDAWTGGMAIYEAAAP